MQIHVPCKKLKLIVQDSTVLFKSSNLVTMEPQFNKPLHNEVLGTTNNFLQPIQSSIEMYGTEPR